MDEDPLDDPTLQINRALLEYAKAKLAAQQHGGTTERLDLSMDMPSTGEGASIDVAAVRELPTNHTGSGPRWLISLSTGEDHDVLMRIKVLADVVLGVMRPPHPPPDLDLTSLEATEKGVSRRHAVLRPGLDYLYLVPLQSTNGTRING